MYCRRRRGRRMLFSPFVLRASKRGNFATCDPERKCRRRRSGLPPSFSSSSSFAGREIFRGHAEFQTRFRVYKKNMTAAVGKVGLGILSAAQRTVQTPQERNSITGAMMARRKTEEESPKES